MIKPKTAWTSMELHGWPGSGNHETKKYGAYVFSKALIWNVHSRSVRAGQAASCCLLFAVWFVVFWCYNKQTKQQQHKTPIVILLRWCFSPDGSWILSASFDKTLRLWLASDGTSEQTLKGNTDVILCGCFSPDGARILSVSCERERVAW